MLIGAVAQQVGISRDSIRFYEKTGLIQSHRRANGYKEYSAQMVDQLELIKLLQQLGFSLAEVAKMLPMMQQGQLPAVQVQAVIDEKISVIDQRIADLQQLKARLQTLPIGEHCPLRRDCAVGS